MLGLEDLLAGRSANGTLKSIMNVASLAMSSKSEKSSMTRKEPRRLFVWRAELTLIKVHVVKMKANLELLHLRDLPDQAAQGVLERSVPSCVNDGLE